MNYVSYVAKAIAAFITAGLGAVATYNLELEPWVLVAATAVLAFVITFVVPNGAKPE